MSARSKLLILTFCLLLVLAAASLYQLFALRFEAGDIFPAGSSLRSDPLGSMALYQALVGHFVVVGAAIFHAVFFGVAFHLAVAHHGTVRGFLYEQETGEPAIFTPVSLKGANDLRLFYETDPNFLRQFA